MKTAPGKAMDKFLEIAKLQGGDVSFLKNPNKYPKAKIHEKIFAKKNGYIESIDSFEIGIASLELGAGRFKIEDKIDPKAGIIFYPKIGMKIKKGNLIAEIFTDKKESVQDVKNKIENALKIVAKKTAPLKIIKSTISHY